MLQVHSKVIQFIIFQIIFFFTYIIFKIIFHYRLVQDIDYSSLGSTVNICCLLHIYIFFFFN